MEGAKIRRGGRKLDFCFQPLTHSPSLFVCKGYEIMAGEFFYMTRLKVTLLKSTYFLVEFSRQFVLNDMMLRKTKQPLKKLWLSSFVWAGKQKFHNFLLDLHNNLEELLNIYAKALERLLGWI